MRLMTISGLTLATVATLSASELSFNRTVEAVQWSAGLISLVSFVTLLPLAIHMLPTDKPFAKSVLAPSFVGMSFAVGITFITHAALLHTGCYPDKPHYSFLYYVLVSMAGFYVGALFSHLVTLGVVLGGKQVLHYRLLALFGVVVGPVIALFGGNGLC